MIIVITIISIIVSVIVNITITITILRSLKFTSVTNYSKTPGSFVQESVQINRPHVDVPFTRSCEYHYLPWKPRRPADQTASTLIFEYPSTEVRALARAYESIGSINKIAQHPYNDCETDLNLQQGEPYYPVPNPRNQELFAKYQVTPS
jgi:UDP-galactopyranose mutase